MNFLDPALLTWTKDGVLREVELFGVTNPVVGLNTYKSPAVLNRDEVPAISNFFCRGGGMQVRGAIDEVLATTGLPSGTVLGEFYGDTGYYRAIGNSTVGCAIYRWVATSSTWSEITMSSNSRYGTTRFTSSTAEVSFACVREPAIALSFTAFQDPLDTYIVWQNGSEYPRIANTDQTYQTATNRREVAIINPIAPPARDQCRATPSFDSYLTINSTNVTVSAATTTTITSSVSTTGGYGRFIDATFKTTLSTTTNSLSVTCTAISVGSFLGQFHLVYDVVDPTFWTKVKVHILWNDGTDIIIHDPSKAESVPNVGSASTEMVGQSISQIAFSVRHGYNSGGSLIAWSAPTTCKGFKLTWVGDPPATDQRIRIYAAGFGNQIEFGANFMVSYFAGCAEASNASGTNVYVSSPRGGSRVESPGIECAFARTPLLSQVGGTNLPGVRLAEQFGFYYKYTVSYPNPTSLSTSNAVTQGITYAKWSNQAEFAIAGVKDIAVAGNSYAYITGAASTALTVDLTREATYGRIAPDGSHQEVPIGTSMLFNLDRLLIANARASTSDTANGTLASSEQGYPFRFRATTRVIDGEIDPRSATKDRIFAGETIKALAPPVASPYGADSLVIVSDRAYYSVDATNASGLARIRWQGEYGTNHPKSLFTYRGIVGWIDQNLSVRMLAGGIESPSDGIIETTLLTIPATSTVISKVFRERLEVNWANTSGTSSVAVFDFRTQKWGLLDKPSIATGFYLVNVSGSLQHWSSATDRKTIRHETTSVGDLGNTTGIASSVTFGRFQPSLTGEIVMGSLWVRSDAASNVTVTARRTTAAGNTDGTMSLTGSGRVFMWDQDANGLPVTATGADDGTVTVSGTFPSGTVIYQIGMELGEKSGGPDR